MIRFILPVLIAAAGITIAQVHGGPFWVALFGSVSLGWAVSLLWEAGSIWLWWRGVSIFSVAGAFKWLATLALIFGMVANGAAPILNQAEQAEQERAEQVKRNARQIAAATVKTEAAQKALDKLLKASVDQQRRGFLPTIKSTLCALGVEIKGCQPKPDAKALEPALTAREAAPEKPALALPLWLLPWAAWVPVAVMPVLYALALLALVTVGREMRGREWRGGIREAAPGKEPDAPNPFPNAQAAGRRKPPPVQGLNSSGNTPERRTITKYAIRNGMANDGKYSQNKVAAAIGEPASTLSEFANGKAGPEVSARITGKLKG